MRLGIHSIRRSKKIGRVEIPKSSVSDLNFQSQSLQRVSQLNPKKIPLQSRPQNPALLNSGGGGGGFNYQKSGSPRMGGGIGGGIAGGIGLSGVDIDLSVGRDEGRGEGTYNFKYHCLCECVTNSKFYFGLENLLIWWLDSDCFC